MLALGPLRRGVRGLLAYRRAPQACQPSNQSAPRARHAECTPTIPTLCCPMAPNWCRHHAGGPSQPVVRGRRACPQWPDCHQDAAGHAADSGECRCCCLLRGPALPVLLPDCTWGWPGGRMHKALRVPPLNTTSTPTPTLPHALGPVLVLPVCPRPLKPSSPGRWWPRIITCPPSA